MHGTRVASVAVRSTCLLLVGLLAACGGDKSKNADAPEALAASSSGLERFFPLEQGKIYHYVTREGSDTGMLVAKVYRSGTRGELRTSSSSKRFVFAPDGISYSGGAYILKAPVEVGNSWPGEHGGTTKIVSTNASVEVPAGRFSSCVQTVEEGGRPTGSRYENTYCPGVGLVLLVVTAKDGEARAELKSYGFPLNINQ